MRRYRIGMLLLAALLLAPLCRPVRGAPVVRVGYFAFPGYHERSEEGYYSGYGYEFLQKVAGHTDWLYEYVNYGSSHAEALEALRRGEVDVVTSVTKTPEREAEFLFSARPVGTNVTMLTVRAGSQVLTAGDYRTYEGLKVGLLRGNTKNGNFAAFARRKGFSWQEKVYETESQLAAGLQSGEVDAAVTGSLRAIRDEWVVETFDAADFYAVTRADRPDLMAELDRAMEEMTFHDPDWRTALHAKYYGMDSGGQVMLSAEERRYLENLTASGEVLTVLVNPDRYPYSYLEDGEIRGIFPDVFALLAGRLNLNCRFLPAEDRESYYRMRSAKEADILLDMVADYSLAERESYKLTDPFIEMNFARVTRRDFQGTSRRVAAVWPSDHLSSYVGKYYTGRDVRPYASAEKCVRAVLGGEADCTVLYSCMAEEAIRRDPRNRLTFTLLGDATASYSMGVRADRSYLLLSALTRAVAGLERAEVEEIIVRRTESSPREMNLITLLYARPIYGVLGMFFVSTFFFVLFLLRQRTRNQLRLREKVEEVSGRYEAQQKSLADALALADQANRAKTTFLNNMSHDIRTPMNAIIGFTALASTHLDNREQTRDYLAKIAQSSSHLLSLINDVMDMSRIESGHVHVENRAENLADILHSLRNIVQADIQAKHLEFFLDTVDVTHEDVLCDRLRLNQILLNLLSNAIKFTEPGGTVSLQVTQKGLGKPDRDEYEFRVRDTGIGMSEEFARHIFEPFTRERTSTVSGIQGTGLGMAITKNIVDMMGGTIEVRSGRGEGTEFTVCLELAFCGASREPKTFVELEGLRALVADDDLVCCQSVSRMLRQIGMRAEWTRYGREAVIRAGEAHELGDPFALYVVDWSMPDQNGVETVRRIRQAVGEDAPIILLSAYDWADIEQEARKAGVTDFISKPLFSSELYRTLERSLGRPEEESPRKAEEEETSFDGRRILLVEDNELNREIAMELLTEAGLRVSWAENGKVAWEMVADSVPGTYHLILMDVQMPVMNGYEATERIRQLADPALARIPVIAMTANAFEEDRQRAAEAGMDGYLAKPIDLDKMFALLREVLRSEPGEGSP